MSEARPRTSHPGRSARSTRSTTTGCCSSPATASRPSTSSCRPRSPTRGACSPGCRGSGSRCCATSSRTTCSRSATTAARWSAGGCEMLPVECVVRGYLAGLGLEGLPRDRRRLGARAPRRAARVRAAAGADLHPGDEGGDGPRREHHRDRGGRARRRPSACTRLERVAIALYATRRRARAGARESSSPTRSSSSASTEDGRLVLGDEALTPDSSRFWPADTYEPGAAQDSFDKQYVRDYCETTRLGQDVSGPGAPGRRRRAARARSTSRRSSGSPGSRSTPTSPTRRWCSREGDRARPAEGRHPRPAGRGRRARARASRLRRLRRARREGRRPRGRRGRRGGGARAGRADVRAAAREPADRVLRDRARCMAEPAAADRRRHVSRVERRPRRAVGARRARTRRRCRVWHEEAELPALDAVVLPGGFSYGDYLRCGAIARFSPATAAVRAFADAGGLVLGICNGFQVLCEAGLLPGVLLRNESLRFVCRDVRHARRADRHAVHVTVQRGPGRS